MKFLIDKKLIELVEKLTLTTYETSECYNDEKKVWINVENVEPLIDDLIYEIEYRDNKIIEVETQINNDYNPEMEIPEIHGKGISW